MLTSVTGQDSSISHHLRDTKRVLQDMILNADIANTTADKAEVDNLEKDAIEIFRLIKSLRNRFTPVNRIPPEVLTLIPDFLDMYFCDRDMITLTHVCRAWREMFISRSSLWSNLDCVHTEKTQAYFERSGSSPINLQLWRDPDPYSLDAFLQIIPQAIGRLKSLSVSTKAEDLQDIISHLSHPAPFLETLVINCWSYYGPQYHVTLPSTIFNGDLPSLCELYLQRIRTKLPWRNMVNLTSFTLKFSSVGNFGQLLDFFESAPHLRKVGVLSTTMTSGGENGRLVSLDHLEKMEIIHCGPTSILLDHLVIPVGAKLVLQQNSDTFIFKDHIPISLDNLKNLSSIAKIHLHLDGSQPLFVRFSGPDGQLRIMAPHTYVPSSQVLESLTRLDTSQTERLRIDSRHGPLSRDLPYRALLPMKNLRTLVLSRFTGLLCAFIDVLNPNTSPSKEVVCPSLQELIFVRRPRKGFGGGGEGEFGMQAVVEMAAARASRGAKLGTIKNRAKLDPMDVLELEKHVLHVQHGPEVDMYEDGSDWESEAKDLGGSSLASGFAFLTWPLTNPDPQPLGIRYPPSHVPSFPTSRIMIRTTQTHS